MRVLVVVTTDARRGAEVEGRRLAERLTELGHEAHAVALARSSGAATIGVPALGEHPLALSTLRALRRAAIDADVVVANGSTTLPACAIALPGTGTPFVYRSIGDPAAWAGGRWRRARTRLFVRRAAAVAALWPAAADAIRCLYGPRHVVVIPNPLPATGVRAEEHRHAVREEWGVPIDAPVVAVIGSLTEEKQVQRAGPMVAAVAGAHLVVVGDGPMRAELDSELRSVLGERVHLTGALDDVTPVYSAADALLLVSRTEGVPGVVLEALSAGCPVVAADVGGVAWCLGRYGRGQVVASDAGDDVWSDVLRAATSGPRPTPIGNDDPHRSEIDAAWAALLAEVTR